MRDEDFNRLFSTQDQKDPLAWVILAVGVIVVVCLTWLYALTHAYAAEDEEPDDPTPYSDEECDMNYGCRDIVWELISPEGVIATGIDTKADCLKLKSVIDAKTAPFAGLAICRSRFVVREES